MAASLGHIGSFNPTVEDWTAYAERIEHYFLANGITDATKKRSILLTVCGPTTYQLIRDLLPLVNPTEKTFAQLVAVVKEHQYPSPSVILRRYTFFTRRQQPDESISNFVAQLRKLAHHCEFGATLDDMLRDRLVCGYRDRRLKFKLLSDPELTLKIALEAAKADETAERGTKDLSRGPSLHKLHGQPPRHTRAPLYKPPTQTPTSGPPTQACSRCGGAHSPATCKYKDSTCHYCQKKGHLASVCRKKARDQKGKTGRKGASKTHQLQADASDSEDAETYPLFYSATPRTKPIEVTVTLNNVETPVEVDTGAALFVMSEATYRSLWKTEACPRLQPSTARLFTYTGERMAVLGQITLHVSYQQQNHRLSILVVPGNGPTLLGRDWLEKIKVDWQGIHLLQQTMPQPSVQQVLDRHPTMFNGELGEIAGSAASLQVEPSKQPRFFKARPVPYSLRAKVEEELTRLQHQGVIKPVTFSDWAAPIVPVVSSGMGT